MNLKTLIGIFLFIVILSIGCAGKRPCGKACESVESKEMEAQLIEEDQAGKPLLNQFVELIESKVEKDDKIINVMSLSAGGEYGAFGAGFMVGWYQSKQIPHFDIVTSVSTGSLLAPFVFLLSGNIDEEEKVQKTRNENEQGKEKKNKISRQDRIKSEIIDLLKRVYGRGLKDSDVVEGWWASNLFKKKAMYSREPLRKMLKDVLTDDILNEIANQYKKNRYLFVGAVNADTGKFSIIDLTGIAYKYKGERRQRLFIDAIMASSAVPVIFPAEFIDGEMYIDGGAREYVFFYGVQEVMDEAWKSVVKDTRELAEEPPKNTFYMVVHGDYTVREQCTSYSPLAIATRSMGIVIDQILRLSVFYNAYLANNPDNINDPWNIKVLTAMDHGCESILSEETALKNNDELFHPKFTKCLYDKGEKIGLEPELEPEPNKKWITDIKVLAKRIEEARKAKEGKYKSMIPNPPEDYGTCKP